MLTITCIAGIARQGKVYIGGDSCGSDYHSWVSVGNTKVFIVQDRFLIGCTSSFRMIDILSYSFEVEDQSPKQTDDHYIRTTFVKALIKCFEDNGGISSTEENKCGNFLLGYRGRLYEIQDDFSVINCPDWGNAVGSGEGPARGSLWTTRTSWDARQRVLQALEASEAVVPSVRGPFLILEI